MQGNKFAVIDVGTNNILLLIAKLENGKLKVLHRDSNISAFGKNMKNNILTEAALRRTKSILIDHIIYSRLFTSNIIVVGTSCSREARNIELLSKWINIKFGLKYNIISGEQEAYLNGIANLNEFREFENIIMFDVGGGSTEFSFIKKGEIISNLSLKLGIRRLVNTFRSDLEEKTNAVKKILNSLKKPEMENFVLVGIGGTATSLCSIKLKLQKYDGSVIHKKCISRKELRTMLRSFERMSNPEIANLIPFDRKRADIIATGTMIVSEILDFFEADKFFISDRGIQFGILNQTKAELQKMLS
ncbi:MAG: hypothetical protein K8R49_03255 [Candidatus Cloacimonetes bacterium]|nr:hypothetical protein [Candidatus Cloacimonadota bacterium]